MKLEAIEFPENIYAAIITGREKGRLLFQRIQKSPGEMEKWLSQTTDQSWGLIEHFEMRLHGLGYDPSKKESKKEIGPGNVRPLLSQALAMNAAAYELFHQLKINGFALPDLEETRKQAERRPKSRITPEALHDYYNNHEEKPFVTPSLKALIIAWLYSKEDPVACAEAIDSIALPEAELHARLKAIQNPPFNDPAP